MSQISAAFGAAFLPPTREEVRHSRRVAGRCVACGRRLPDYPELRRRDIDHRCFSCSWRAAHGTWPAPAPWERAV